MDNITDDDVINVNKNYMMLISKVNNCLQVITKYLISSYTKKIYSNLTTNNYDKYIYSMELVKPKDVIDAQVLFDIFDENYEEIIVNYNDFEPFFDKFNITDISMQGAQVNSDNNDNNIDQYKIGLSQPQLDISSFFSYDINTIGIATIKPINKKLHINGEIIKNNDIKFVDIETLSNLIINGKVANSYALQLETVKFYPFIQNIVLGNKKKYIDNVVTMYLEEIDIILADIFEFESKYNLSDNFSTLLRLLTYILKTGILGELYKCLSTYYKIFGTIEKPTNTTFTIKDFFTIVANDDKCKDLVALFYNDENANLSYDYLFRGGFFQKSNFIELLKVVMIVNISNIIMINSVSRNTEYDPSVNIQNLYELIDIIKFDDFIVSFTVADSISSSEEPLNDGDNIIDNDVNDNIDNSNIIDENNNDFVIENIMEGVENNRIRLLSRYELLNMRSKLFKILKIGEYIK
jgi:hypothetical protein